MDTELVVLYFASVEAAEHGWTELRQLEAGGFLEIDECVILSCDEQGRTTAKSADNRQRARAGLGGALGLVVGGVIGVPILGLLAGAGGAARLKDHADRLGEMIATIGTEMERGTGVLALTLRSLDDPATVTDRLQINRDGLIRADIPAELSAEIDRALGN